MFNREEVFWIFALFIEDILMLNCFITFYLLMKGSKLSELPFFLVEGMTFVA
jgi:hypothetical protein